MEDISVLIAGIDFKLRKLTGQHKHLKDANTILEQRVKEQELIINQQKLKIHELQEKIETVNIAKTLASRFEISDAKNKIGDLVREIDKCIDLLNK